MLRQKLKILKMEAKFSLRVSHSSLLDLSIRSRYPLSASYFKATSAMKYLIPVSTYWKISSVDPSRAKP